MEYCPALAYSKDEVTGAVTVDEDKCIGCKYCTWVCPYDAPQVKPGAGVIHKCTFCDHRLAEGLRPACVTSCPTGALGFGDHDPTLGEAEHLGFPRTGLDPAIRFTPLRDGGSSLVGETAGPGVVPSASTLGHTLDPAPASKIGLRSEWTLVVSSLLATLLVGFAAVPMAAAPALAIPPLVLVGAGVLGMGISTLHLGRKTRAWRAILNWRRSWLSREILLYSTFLSVFALHAWTGMQSEALRWVCLGVGVMLLHAIDSVYRVTLPRRPWFHSGQVLWSGLLLVGIAVGLPWLFVPTGLLIGTGYVARKRGAASSGRSMRGGLAAVRLGVGLVLPLVLWIAMPAGGIGAWLALAGLLIGAAVDRSELYLELEISSPARQMHLDWKQALKESRGC